MVNSRVQIKTHPYFLKIKKEFTKLSCFFEKKLNNLEIKNFHVLRGKIITLRNSWNTVSKSIYLKKTIIHYSNKVLQTLPIFFDTLAEHTHPQTKELYLKNIYIRQLEIKCADLCEKNAFLYFGFFPTLILATIIVIFHCVPRFAQHNTENFYQIPVNNLNTSIATNPLIPAALVSSIPPLAQQHIAKLPLPIPALIKAAPQTYPASKDGLEYANITIHKSIYLSGKRAGVPSKLISQMMNIFSGTVNFAKELHDGDHVSFVYGKTTKPVSTVVKKGRKKVTVVKNVSSTEILAAEIIGHKKTYRAIRFTNSAGQTDYYTPEGVTVKPAFVRAPANYTHIASKFNLHRWHPILHIYRPHKGVDFAAPIGTPIKATGAGRIVFAGWEGDYGKVVLIQHDSKYSSFYAHLSGFAKNLKAGTYVKKGQLIAFMGMTGLATGPHVHYELRINGVQHDPLTTPLPHLAIDSKAGRAKFFAFSKNVLAQLKSHSAILITSKVPSRVAKV